MKYKIICSCGHEIIIDVYGETLTHEKKLLFYRENECPDCLIRSLEKQESKNYVFYYLSISYIRLMLSLP